MEIRLKDFVIKESLGINRYDLHIIKEVKDGENKGGLRESPFAYGITMERCIQAIIQHRLEHSLDIVDLTNFIKHYKEISENLIKEIKKVVK